MSVTLAQMFGDQRNLFVGGSVSGSSACAAEADALVHITSASDTGAGGTGASFYVTFN